MSASDGPRMVSGHYWPCVESGHPRNCPRCSNRCERDRPKPTITEFLLARIAEDEGIGRDWRHHPSKVQVYGGGTGYLRLANPDRVLVECEAKRRIVERHRELRQVVQFGRPETESLGCETCWRDEYDPFGPDREPYPCPTIKDLASVYADHPDYRDEWRA